MTPFFIDIILEPLRKRNARIRAEIAEREYRRQANIKAREKLEAERAKRGCGHAGRGVTCHACYYFSLRRSRNRFEYY